MPVAPVESKAPKGNRKEFVRTRVPVAERVAGIASVALLGVIAAVIWWQGKHFDPSRFALRTEALKSTTEAVEGKDATARGEGGMKRGVQHSDRVSDTAGAGMSGEGYESAGLAPATQGGASAAVQGEPLEIRLSGLKPMSDTEFYAADTLYEKINGRAPAYLNFNVQQLRSRSFEIVGGAGSYVDVYEFRFDTPVNAFGMFALERDPKGGKLEFAPDGYAGEMGFFFRQGTVYVQVIASDQNPKTMALAQAVAENRAQTLPADDAGLDARRRLPVTGLDATTVQYVEDNAQGQSFLKGVFQATYDFGGKKLPFFVMVTTAADAAAAWQSFQDFSGKFGGKVTVLPEVNGVKIFQAESFGTWKIIYQRDGELGGVFDADDVDKARQFVEEYLRGKMP